MSTGLSTPNKVEQAVGEKTKVAKAHSKFNVLRTSIPAGVRSALNVQVGDELAWNITAKGNKVVVEVTKA